MSFNQTLQEIKESNQDFEWYPTTKDILEVVTKDIEKEIISTRYGRTNTLKILDVGAGNGSSLNYFKDNLKEIRTSLFAIEKSQILINNMNKDIFIIGTDFYQQSFIDKTMDVIFCNPPYSNFEYWTNKIIKESKCEIM